MHMYRAPECTRAGSYSQRGKDYGDSQLRRLTLGYVHTDVYTRGIV